MLGRDIIDDRKSSARMHTNPDRKYVLKEEPDPAVKTRKIVLKIFCNHSCSWPGNNLCTDFSEINYDSKALAKKIGDLANGKGKGLFY